MRQSTLSPGSRNATRLAAILLLAFASRSSAQQAACATTQHRQFDFWLGEWEVTDSRGQRIGASRVDRVPGGCGVLESWIGVNGSRGQSLSEWDETDGKWHYSWSEDDGTVANLSGGIINGEMVMEGEWRQPGGSTTLERIIWTPNADGTVRQLWQSSRDMGMRRTDVFDVVYRKN